MRTIRVSVEYGMILPAGGAKIIALTVPDDATDEDVAQIAREAAAKAFADGSLTGLIWSEVAQATGHCVHAIVDIGTCAEIVPDGFPLLAPHQTVQVPADVLSAWAPHLLSILQQFVEHLSPRVDCLDAPLLTTLSAASCACEQLLPVKPPVNP